MVVLSALMIWKGLMVLSGSESPIVVVLRYVAFFFQAQLHSYSRQAVSSTPFYATRQTNLVISILFSSFSGSMEPVMYRGDLLFLNKFDSDPVRVGEILVEFLILYRTCALVCIQIYIYTRTYAYVPLYVLFCSCYISTCIYIFMFLSNSSPSSHPIL